MHIGLDITSILYQRGVSRYTANLVQSLQELPGMHLSLYGSSFRGHTQLRSLTTKLAAKPNTQLALQHFPPSVLSLLWRFGRNPIQPLLPGIELFHSWDWLQPPDKHLPLVSTIHDLAILKFPETAHPRIVKMHHRAWKILRERDAHIIAVSRITRKDIIEHLEIEPQRVHVVYEALPREVRYTTESLSEDLYQQLKQQLALTKPYILFVGTREPRKNLQRLIEAWEPLQKDVQLLIAGDQGWDQTNRLAKATNPNLRFLGQVSDRQLAVLYSEAELLAYPSLYEGFGLPILEAFHHGTPVVTSNVSSMKEVAGNAAELVDPLSTEAIRQGLKTVLNEDLAQQKQRLQKMIIRLQMFSWQKVAEETRAVYSQALEEFHAQ